MTILRLFLLCMQININCEHKIYLLYRYINTSKTVIKQLKNYPELQHIYIVKNVGWSRYDKRTIPPLLTGCHVDFGLPWGCTGGIDSLASKTSSELCLLDLTICLLFIGVLP